MIPAADVGERDLDADVRFDELGNLPHAVAEAPLRIVRTRGGLIGRLLNRLQERDSFERLAPGAVENLIARSRVHRLQYLTCGGVADREVIQVLDGDGVLRAAQSTGQSGSEADGANRGNLAGLGWQSPVEPSVGGALQTRRARFHVILRVEVRARRVGRSRCMNDRQALLLP